MFLGYEHPERPDLHLCCERGDLGLWLARHPEHPQTGWLAVDTQPGVNPYDASRWVFSPAE